MVAWISFFIMPEAAPARVTLGISSLIAMVLQYGNMASSLPKVKNPRNIIVLTRLRNKEGDYDVLSRYVK